MCMYMYVGARRMWVHWKYVYVEGVHVCGCMGSICMWVMGSICMCADCVVYDVCMHIHIDFLKLSGPCRYLAR